MATPVAHYGDFNYGSRKYGQGIDTPPFTPPVTPPLPPLTGPSAWRRVLANVRAQRNLPMLYAPGSTMRVLAEAVAAEYDIIWQTIDEMTFQTQVEQASWGIEHLEKTAGLPVQVGLTLEERRSAVRAILRPAGSVNLGAIAAFMQRFPFGNVGLSFTPLLSLLNVAFQDERGTPVGVTQAKAGLSAMLPAWIAVNFDFRFTTHLELKSWAVTLGALRALHITHAQLRTWVPSGSLAAASQTGNLGLTFTSQASIIAEPGNLALTFVQPNITVLPGG